MSECVIISGTLSAKLCHKLFAHFHRRFVELVYVERQIAQDTKSGHYELRLFKNKDKATNSLYSLVIDPTAMDCFVNVLHSKKHRFTFVCCSGRTSLCLSARTKFERDAWLSVLEQLRWQFQPNSDLDAHDDANSSLSVTSSDDASNSPSQSAQSPISQDFASESEHDEAVSHILALTQQNGANDHSYFYNYTDSNLYRHCSTRATNTNTQRCTILGLLSATDATSKDKVTKMSTLESVKSPKYQAMHTTSAHTALSVLSC